MSLYVAGFDFGTQNCTIAVAQKGGIDVIANEVSNRLTPTMVAYDEKQRHLGESALTQYQRNIKNTITNIKQLLGHPWDDPELQNEIKNLPFKVVKNPESNQPEVEVMLAGEKKTFSMVAVTASLLVKLKDITEKACQGRPCKDVVISCPGFWTDQQRRALLDASKIAGLNCLRVFNEITATALNYGIYRTELSDTTPTYVLFVDMGAAYTSVGVVEFLKGKLKVLSTAYDRTLGGRNFDDVLVDHFLKEFQEKHKIDIRSNQRALIRLQVAAEKLKKVLNQNPDGILSIDSIMNDIDVKGKLKREQYVDMCSALLSRLEGPIKQALADANLTPEQLASVEVTGSASRFKPVQAKIAQILNKPEVSNTLNSEESVCRGCALQCAMLSPVFRVREFSVTDISAYPIKFSWKDLGPDAMIIDSNSLEVFSKNSVVPFSRNIVLYRNTGFELIGEYVAGHLPPGIPTMIGKWIVPEVPASTGPEPHKIRVKVSLDLNGLVIVESTQLVESLEEKEAEKPATDAKPAEQTTQGDQTPPAKEGTKEAEMKDAPKEEPKKKKVRRSELSFSRNTSSLQEKEIANLTESEAQLSASDRLVFETAEKKNAVESYVYEMRSKLSESLAGFITEADKEKFLTLLQATEDWLYNEGEEQTKSVYVNKLNELHALGDPVVRRKNEAENRPQAIKDLKAAILNYKLLADSLDPKYEHITKEERQKVLAKVSEIEIQANEKIGKQEGLPSHVNPVVLVSELEKMKLDLEQVANSILNRPKPAPPKPEPKKEEPKKEEPKKEEPKKEEPQQQQQQTPKPEEDKNSKKEDNHMDLD